MNNELIKKRGRKVGSGVLNNIDPQSSGISKRLQLMYGRSYGDGISWIVRWVRNVGRMKQDLEERRKALSEKKINDAEYVQITDEKLNSRGKFKKIRGKRFSVAALNYWKLKRYFESENNSIYNYLHGKIDDALVCQDADWFRKLADAVEAEKQAVGTSDVLTYPLHSALLDIAGVPKISRTATVYPEVTTGESMTLPYTLRELGDMLEKRGLRPSKISVGDDAWLAQIRNACRDLGLQFLPGKIGRPTEAD